MLAQNIPFLRPNCKDFIIYLGLRFVPTGFRAFAFEFSLIFNIKVLLRQYFLSYFVIANVGDFGTGLNYYIYYSWEYIVECLQFFSKY